MDKISFLDSADTRIFLTMFHVYVDESGKKGDHPLVTVVFMGLPHSRLSSLDDAWNGLLRQYELAALHMAKASRLNEPCGSKMLRRQSVDKRTDALIPFADCIAEHLEVGTIYAFDVSGFKSFKNETKNLRSSPNDPYYLAFVRSLLDLIDYVRGDEKISLICDDDLETAWQCFCNYRAVKIRMREVKERVVCLAFADDEYFPALQVADFVAYLSRLEARKTLFRDFNLYHRLCAHLFQDRGAGFISWRRVFADHKSLSELGKEMARIKQNEKEQRIRQV